MNFERKLNANGQKKGKRLGSGASQAVCFEQEWLRGSDLN